MSESRISRAPCRREAAAPNEEEEPSRAESCGRRTSEKLAESSSGREADECGGGSRMRAVRSRMPRQLLHDDGGGLNDAADGEEALKWEGGEC